MNFSQVKTFSDPWHHLVADNFLNFDFLENLYGEAQLKLQNKKFGNFLFNDRNFSRQTLLSHAEFEHQLLSNCRLILAEYFPRHRMLIKPTLSSYLAVHPVGYIFLPHCDRFDKVLSTVTYIDKQSNNGTYLYQNKRSNPIQIDWKANRCLIFAGQTGKTWHSYSSGTTPRITFSAFVADKFLNYLASSYHNIKNHPLISNN